MARSILVIIATAAGLLRAIWYSSNFIERKDDNTLLRLYLGLHNTTVNIDPGLGGDMPDVQTYDEYGRFVTRTTRWFDGEKKIGPGGFYTYLMQSEKGDATPSPPAYLSIRHYGDDPICIAAVSVQGPENSEFHIMGDLMHQTCGWIGYPSVRDDWNLGSTNGTRSCFWVGGHPYMLGKNRYLPNNIWLHLPDLIGNLTAHVYNNNTDLVCKSEPRMHAQHGDYEDFWPLVFSPPLTYAENNDGSPRDYKPTQHDPDAVLNHTNWRWRENGKLTEVTLGERLFEETRRQKRRALPSNNGTADSQFRGYYTHTNSSRESLSAVRLCQDESVWGPDVANSHERKFCNFATREVIPYCDTKTQADCFDIETESVRASAPISSNMALMANASSNASAAFVVSEVKTIRYEFAEEKALEHGSRKGREWKGE